MGIDDATHRNGRLALIIVLQNLEYDIACPYEYVD